MDLYEAAKLLGLGDWPEARSELSVNKVEKRFAARTRRAVHEGDFARVVRLADARSVILADLENQNKGNQPIKLATPESFDTTTIQVMRQSEAELVSEYLQRTKGHFFVTGGAGTGKTYLLKTFVQEYGRDKVALVAPTGLAALQSGGETIHSFFKLKPGILIDNLDWLHKQSPSLAQKLRAVETLVIDEVSMVSPDMMDVIDLSLRKARKSSIPFGGVRVIMFGDLMQLSPVIPREQEARQLVLERYQNNYWFFSAKVWQDAVFYRIDLKEVHRQKSDPDFIDFLTRLRVNELDPAHMGYINQRVRAALPPNTRPMRLHKTNQDVFAFNKNQMDALGGASRIFIGVETVHVENYKKAKEEDLPAPLELELKVGAQVMFTKNSEEKVDSEEEESRPRWVNGEVGVVTAFTDSGVMVRVGEKPPIEVTRATWEVIRHEAVEDQSGTPKLKPIVVAEYSQLPLRAAWAITIHKAQGQTLAATILDLSGNWNLPGMAYVALSRVRSVTSLSLLKPLTREQVKVDSNAVFFLKTKKPMLAKDITEELAGGTTSH